MAGPHEWLPDIGAGGLQPPDPDFRSVRGAPPGEDVQVRDVLQAVLRRRWLFISMIAAAIGCAAAYASFVTPVYEATASVVIEPEVPRALVFGSMLGREPVKSDYYQTQYEILRSRALAKATLDELGLWSAPELTTSRPSRLDRLRRHLSWMPGVGDRTPATPAERSEPPSQARVIDAFLSRLNVVPHVESRIVEIGWRSTDRELAASAANGVAHAYIGHDVDSRFSESRGVSDALQQRVDEQRRRVTASEMELQKYREQNNIVKGRQDVSVQGLSDLNAALTHARTVRIEKETLYNRLAVLESDPARIDTFPDALTNPYIQQLKFELAKLQQQEVEASTRLGDDHPDMIKIRSAIRLAEEKLRTELQRIAVVAKNDYLTAHARERSLASALESQKQEVLKDSRKAIEYDVLERNAASDRQLLESLLQRTKEAGISGELRASNVRILDLAEVPSTPVWPRRNLILLIAAVLGGLVATLVALALEYLDDRLTSSEQIRAHLRLRPLGLVPELRKADLTRPGVVASDCDVSHFSERFRFVRANALYSSARNGNRCFVVTSAGPGEGKTVVASNLASALSRAGDRVLLIDADMRSPRVHSVFAQPGSPGLADLLQGRASEAEIVRPSGIPNLFIVPGGSPTERSADLLARRSSKEAIARLRATYDWVVIDSPPLGPVVDACLVAHAGSEVLFVVGAGQTSRRAARLAVDQLHDAGVPIAGVVLNRADAHEAGDHYSGYYATAHPKRGAR